MDKNKPKLTEAQIEKMTKAAVTSVSEQNLRDRYAQTLKSEYAYEVKPKKTANYLKYAALILTTLALMALAYFVSNKSSEIIEEETPLLMAEVFLDEPYPFLNRRKGITELDLKNKAGDAYSTQDYKSAISNYEELAKTKNLDIENQFYLGLSLLYDGQTSQAIEVFERAQDMEFTSNFRSTEEINWYLSLAYVKANKLEEAKLILSQIADNKKWKHEAAKKLISQFKFNN